MTVKALQAAANQKSNRDPVTAYTESEIRDALEALRKDVLAWRSEGARAERWNESVTRRLELDGPARAVLTLLLLRGPQTPGELRSRSDRLHSFESLASVEECLQSMSGDFEPLVTELPRRPGQKESRWAHLLGENPEDSASAAAPPEPGPTARPASASDDLGERVQALEEQVADILQQLRQLQQRPPGGD